MLARVAVVFMLAVVTMLAGHAGGIELAALGLAMAPQFVFLLVGIGAVQGILVLVAQAAGAGEDARAGAVLRVGIAHALVLGIAAGLVLQGAGAAFAAIGQEPALAARAGEVAAALGWGMPGVMLFTACTFFLEGLGRPRPGLVVMIGGNLVSAGLAVLWVGTGEGPGGGQGAVGAAWAITAARTTMGLVLAAYVWRLPERGRLGIRAPAPGRAELGRRLRRLGYPLALAQGLESASFAGLVVLAGYLGPEALGAYQVAMNLVATVFMVAIGIATAAAVRVGRAVGRHDQPNMARAGWTALGTAAVLMGLVAAAFRALPEEIAALYTADPAILGPAAACVAFAAWFVVFDGLQGVAMGALRGAGDVWVPSALQMVAFWILGLPAGAWLAFRAGQGVLGLFGGISIGVAAAAFLLAARFALVSRRPVSRA